MRGFQESLGATASWDGVGCTHIPLHPSVMQGQPSDSNASTVYSHSSTVMEMTCGPYCCMFSIRTLY